MDNPQADAGPGILDGAVDVHAHFLSAGYRKALGAAGLESLDGMPAGIPHWTAGLALDLMDEAGIAMSVLSISSPGVLLEADDRVAVGLARRVNDDAAQIARAHPDRFGFFASLPLPHVDASIAEIGRSMEELSASGVVLLTNYRGCYLGDARFDPVFQELDRRRSVVFLHPTAPPGGSSVAPGYPPPLLEFIFDTTRAVVSLMLSRTLDRYPGIRLIVPHGGAALPVLADRVERVGGALERAAGHDPVDVRSILRRLYYDVAGGTPDGILPALLRLADPDRLLYGSDYPFTPPSRVRELAALLQTTALLSEQERPAVLAGNASALLRGHGPGRRAPWPVD
jgi:predicted TIM-barrel fold metal-dependent hydrolase